MKTQISRNSFDVEKRYSGVYQQMGRMFTDADWNELSTLSRDRLAMALQDVIGDGTPKNRGIVVSDSNPDGSTRYELQWGHAYVEGHMAELRPSDTDALSDPLKLAFEYNLQADYPFAAPLPAGDHRLYLDVWERTVTALEDPALMDAGLHGADTCSRTQTMAQVKWCPLTVEPEDSTQNWPIGKARLDMAIRAGSTLPDPCDPCADELALQDKLGNYLFRVEIHSVEFDTSGQAQRLVLKWSAENGAEQAKVGEEPLGFIHQNWTYEFFSGAGAAFVTEKHPGRHFDPSTSPRVGELSSGYPNTVPAGFELVRRWDGFCVLLRDGLNWRLDTSLPGVDRGTTLATGTAATDHGHVVEGSSVMLQLDTMTLQIDLGENPVLSGDYWQAAVREAEHVAGSVLLDKTLPDGIRHHYMCLGDFIGGEFRPSEKHCKRFEFPPLTDIEASDVCYSNDVCDMPDVRTVQNAIDYLCQERDLKWHNKHLHGWGIVCGLIAECCTADAMAHHADTHTIDHEDDVQPGVAADRRSVCVTKGYAINCHGEDVVLDKPTHVPVMKQIEALEQAGKQVLDNGNGSVCLRIDLDDSGQPDITIEPYDRRKHKKSLLDDTLLKDFYDHCIVDLFESIKGEFSFMDADELEVVEEGATSLVSNERRKFTSVMNLLVQLLNRDNGQYVYLSHKEHLILKDIYLSLRKKLRSKTFCAMFQADDFPEYPFRGDESSTYFGKNKHKRTRLHPTAKKIYTYGGTDRTINVYDCESQKLVEVLEMPAPEGAEITAITFSADGDLLYASANVRQVDSVFGVARVGDKHVWEKMTILCNIKVMEMITDPKDDERIFATGYGKGLYYLRPAMLLDATKPQVTPVYAFNACGHMTLDNRDTRVYCTALKQATEPLRYDTVAICDVSKNGNEMDPTISLPLMGGEQSGTDGLAVGNARNNEEGHLYVIMDGGESGKQLLTLPRPKNAETREIAILELENTQVSPAWNKTSDQLILAMEDSYRLQLVDNNGKRFIRNRVPVQVQPVDVVVDSDSGSVYTLNFVSNTLTFIPKSELDYPLDKLDELAKYRTAVLRAFWNLASGLLQYIKDCFCHHLLVKCPTCDEDDVIYLACAEIRDHEVYKICNFDLRKTVKSFPTMEYWFSLIPIEALIKQAFSKFCCWVLPDFLGKYEDQFIPDPKPATESKKTKKNNIKADWVRKNLRTWDRVDTKSIWRDQAKGFKTTGTLLAGGAKNFLKTNQVNQPGVKKHMLLEGNAEDAVVELKKHRVEVVERQKYDPEKSAFYLAEMQKVPTRMPPGTELIQVEKEGKVVSYVMRHPETIGVANLPPDVVEKVKDLEARKARIADLTEVDKKIDSAEKRRKKILELEEANTELGKAEARKAALADLSAISSKIEVAEARRKKLLELADAETRLSVLESRKTTLADVSELNDLLEAVEVRHKAVAETDAAETKLAELEDKKRVNKEALRAMETQVKKLREANAAESARLAEMQRKRATLNSQLQGFSESFKVLEKRMLAQKIELARERPVRELAGVNANLDRELRELGIRSMAELSKVDPQLLKSRTSITNIATARRLVKNAGQRIKTPGP